MSNISHVLVSLRVRPVLGQDQAGVFLVLDLPARVCAAQTPRQAQAQATDACEQFTDAQGPHSPSSTLSVRLP